MAIFRGVGGSGDSSDNSYLQEVTAQANAAEASATSAANSLAAIQDTEVTSATFNTSDGVLTLTKTGGATVTADLDGRFLTSYTETDPVFSAHASSGITATQISNWDTAYGWGNHASAGYLTSETSHADVLVDGDFASAGFMKTDGAGNYSIDTATYIGNNEGLLVKALYEGNSDTNAFTNADHSKLDGIEANADVTDTANVTSAGAAMLASSPTFTGTITAPNVDISTTGTVTTNIATGTGGLGNTKTLNLGTGYGGSLVGLTTVNIGSQSTTCQNTVNIGSGVSVTNREDTINLKGNVTVDGTTNIVTEYPFFNNLAHGSGGQQTLNTTLTTIGTAFDTPSGIGSKHIDFSLDMIYYNVNYTNDGELKVCVETPSPSSETTINLGTVQSTSNPTSYMKEWQVTGNFVKHFSVYCGLSKNNSSGGTSMGLIYNYRYDVSTNRTIVTTGLYTNSPSVGDTIYLHPFDWEAQGTTVEGNSYKLDGTTDFTMEMRRDFTQNLGYFTSSISVSVKAKKINASGTHIDNIVIDAIQGKTVKIRN